MSAMKFWMNRPKMLSNALESIYKGYSGLTFAIDWTRTEAILLTYKAHDGIIVAKEWSCMGPSEVVSLECVLCIKMDNPLDLRHSLVDWKWNLGSN